MMNFTTYFCFSQWKLEGQYTRERGGGGEGGRGGGGEGGINKSTQANVLPPLTAFKTVKTASCIQP